MRTNAETMVDLILDGKYEQLKEAEHVLERVLNEELSTDDFSEFFNMMKQKGMDDEKKHEGMLTKAKNLAKEQGKEGDKKTILGIMKGFLGRG